MGIRPAADLAAPHSGPTGSAATRSNVPVGRRLALKESCMRVSRQAAWFSLTTVRKAIVVAAAAAALLIGLGLIFTGHSEAGGGVMGTCSLVLVGVLVTRQPTG